MREHRRRFVSLACIFIVALAAAAVGVGAGAAAPARAAQPPLSLWWTTFNGSPETECWIDSAKAPDGSLFAGGFENWNSLGGGGDLLVAKFDGNDTAADHQIWQRTWDNPDAHSSDETAAIAVDHSGAVIVVGSSETTNNGWEWVVVKWDANGNQLWQQTFPGSAHAGRNAFAWDVACNAAGDVYVCGTSQTGKYKGAEVKSLVVRKLRGADGQLIWQRSYAGLLHSANQATKLALDSAGNAYCNGYGTNAQVDTDIVTCKFRAGDGRLLWAHRIADARHLRDEGADIVVRGADVWVAGGEYTSNTNRVVALAKYTKAGKRLWLRTWLERTDTTEYPSELAVDKHGDAVVVGAGNNAAGTREHAFVVRWNTAGVLEWWRVTYDTVTHEASWTTVVCDPAGNIWTGGWSATAGSQSFIVAGYTPAGAQTWLSAWKGPDDLGGACNTLCLGQSGLFAGGSVTPQVGGDDAAAVKYPR